MSKHLAAVEIGVLIGIIGAATTLASSLRVGVAAAVLLLACVIPTLLRMR